MTRIALGRLLMRGLMFAGLWLILTRADPFSWVIGLPVVLAATWASRRMEFARPDPVSRGAAGSVPGMVSVDLIQSDRARLGATWAVSTHWLILDIRRLPAFLGFFLATSVRGGVDVSRRILTWPLAISPGFLTYRTALRHPGARIFFLDLISLLPGTLSADLEVPNRLVIHVLDLGAENYRELAQLELQVARLFRESIRAGTR
ncbi:Na+/H+ antiporter subunit E [Thiorhodovibrio winogradskyi]|nr:Na+/H+ antiporter subunit E [Thiorhodovibrio winogradskyi]